MRFRGFEHGHSIVETLFVKKVKIFDRALIKKDLTEVPWDSMQVS